MTIGCSRGVQAIAYAAAGQESAPPAPEAPVPAVSLARRPSEPSSPGDFPGADEAWCWLEALKVRNVIFGPELQSEYAWGVLLYLYGASARGEQTQITALAPMTGYKPSTAGRWTRALIETGLVQCWPDPADRRRTFVGIAPRASALMAAFFGRVAGRVKFVRGNPER